MGSIFLNIITPNKKAHPEGCAEKVFPQFVATQTDISPYGEKGNTFYQGIIRMMKKIIQFASQIEFNTFGCFLQVLYKNCSEKEKLMI